MLGRLWRSRWIHRFAHFAYHHWYYDTSHGPGPMEALEAYMQQFPDDYRRDIAREMKFGFTFAPRGFLIRN
jgi:cephalosporin hydroxylase